MMSRILLISWRILVVLIFLFLPAPILIVIASSFSESGYLSFPPGALSLRWYEEFFASSTWLQALWISALIAIAVALLTTLLSFLAGLAATRIKFLGRNFFNFLMLSPLLFPHAAIGVALIGILAKADALGTYAGILLAHAILCVPFAYRPMVNSMMKLDHALEEAAMMLGARPMEVFRKITIPLLKPGFITALLFSFIISFDEVTVTVFLLGPDTITLPTRIFIHIQESGSPVIAAISTFLVAITILIVVFLERVVGLEFFMEIER